MTNDVAGVFILLKFHYKKCYSVVSPRAKCLTPFLFDNIYEYHRHTFEDHLHNTQAVNHGYTGKREEGPDSTALTNYGMKSLNSLKTKLYK